MSFDHQDSLRRYMLGEDVTCGTCVVFNGAPEAEVGACSILGERRRDEAPCRRWFSTVELHRPLYGRDR